MSRKPTRRMPPTREPPATIPQTSQSPVLKRIHQQEFARRLFQALQQRGWSQSDLARQAFGTTEDADGYKVAKGRDRISSYIRGLNVPEPRYLKKIADVLGMSTEELAPDLYQNALEREPPAVSFHEAAGHPGKAHLVVNKVVAMSVAVKIIQLLEEDGHLIK